MDLVQFQGTSSVRIRCIHLQVDSLMPDIFYTTYFFYLQLLILKLTRKQEERNYKLSRAATLIWHYLTSPEKKKNRHTICYTYYVVSLNNKSITTDRVFTLFFWLASCFASVDCKWKKVSTIDSSVLTAWTYPQGRYVFKWPNHSQHKTFHKFKDIKSSIDFENSEDCLLLQSGDLVVKFG